VTRDDWDEVFDLLFNTNAGGYLSGNYTSSPPRTNPDTLTRNAIAALLAEKPSHTRMQIKIPEAYHKMFEEAREALGHFLETASPLSFSQFFEIAKHFQEARGQKEPSEELKKTLIYESMRRKSK
jgi:hypothetical protein